MKKNDCHTQPAGRHRHVLLNLLLFAVILCGCGAASPVNNGKNDSSVVKEDHTVKTPPDTHGSTLTDTEHYSCTVGGKTIAFDAPAGYKEQDPVSASYVSNLSFSNLSLGGGASGMIDVIVTAPEYEQALSAPTERTAEEYLTSFANRTEASDVSFGDYSGYYVTYLWDRYARKGTHHITQTYSLFSGDTRIQVSLTISNTKEDLPDAPYITNIEIHDE